MQTRSQKKTGEVKAAEAGRAAIHEVNNGVLEEPKDGGTAPMRTRSQVAEAGGEAACHEEVTTDETEIEEVGGNKVEETKKGVVPKKRPSRYLREGNCEGEVLMWCRWCDWVKPVPEHLFPTTLVAHIELANPGVMYVDYLTKKPPKGFKKSNVYKKTLAHLWRCAKKEGGQRSDFGPFFDKTYGGKPTLEPTRFDSTDAPREQDRDRCKPRFMTLEKCCDNDTILKCNKCEQVRRWPASKLALLDTMKMEVVDRGVKVVALDQDATQEMRNELQWRKMRAHRLGHGGMPKLYRLEGGSYCM
jgi:hypothetical protein